MCLQVGRNPSGTLVVGNATIIAADVGAANGVVHVMNRFPLLNAAFNTTMVAALEAAGDFGPFDEAKVSSLASFFCCTTAGVWGEPRVALMWCVRVLPRRTHQRETESLLYCTACTAACFQMQPWCHALGGTVVLKCWVYMTH